MKKQIKAQLTRTWLRALPLLSVSILPILLVGAYFVLHNPAVNTLEGVIHDEPLPLATVFGYSESGRAIEGYTFGAGERCLFLFGAIHGNEKGTKELLDLLVKRLTIRPDLIDSKNSVVIIPLANPDGYFARNDKLNSHAVNLNRNFATTDWIRFEDRGNPETFAGDEPFSEAESQVIKAAAEGCESGAMLAFHSRGALVSPEADEGSQRLGQWYAERTGYEFYDEWDYAGTATRWFVETSGYPAITVELTDHERSDWSINKHALFTLIGSDVVSTFYE